MRSRSGSVNYGNDWDWHNYGKNTIRREKKLHDKLVISSGKGGVFAVEQGSDLQRKRRIRNMVHIKRVGGRLGPKCVCV